jgi:hypothetical protein
MTAITSMKWLFNVVVVTRWPFSACDRKENGTIFGSLGRPVETNLRAANRDRDACCTNVARRPRD